MDNSKVYGLVAVGTSALALVPSTFAAPYTLSGADVTSLGTVGSDTASSLIGVVVDILPVMIPLIVVGFVIKFIMSKFGGGR